MPVRKAKTRISWQRPLIRINGIMCSTESSCPLSTSHLKNRIFPCTCWKAKTRQPCALCPGLGSHVFQWLVFYHPCLSRSLVPLLWLCSWSYFHLCCACQLSFLRSQFSPLYLDHFLLSGKEMAEAIQLLQVWQIDRFASADFWCWTTVYLEHHEDGACGRGILWPIL